MFALLISTWLGEPLILSLLIMVRWRHVIERDKGVNTNLQGIKHTSCEGAVELVLLKQYRSYDVLDVPCASLSLSLSLSLTLTSAVCAYLHYYVSGLHVFNIISREVLLENLYYSADYIGVSDQLYSCKLIELII